MITFKFKNWVIEVRGLWNGLRIGTAFTIGAVDVSEKQALAVAKVLYPGYKRIKVQVTNCVPLRNNIFAGVSKRSKSAQIRSNEPTRPAKRVATTTKAKRKRSSTTA